MPSAEAKACIAFVVELFDYSYICTSWVKGVGRRNVSICGSSVPCLQTAEREAYAQRGEMLVEEMCA
jgi:hypothetical protein